MCIHVRIHVRVCKSMWPAHARGAEVVMSKNRCHPIID